MDDRKRWWQAFAISILVHCLLFAGIGWLSARSFFPQFAEQSIELELTGDTPTSGILLSPLNQPAPPETVGAALPALTDIQTPFRNHGNTVDVDANPAAGPVATSTPDGSGVTQTADTAAAGGESSRSLSPAPPAGTGISDVLAPRILRRIEPAYPEEARKYGWEGRVVLKIEILPTGQTGDVSVERSSGYKVLDDAAVQAVGQWRFIPAQNAASGMPVRCFTSLVVIFKLNPAAH